METKAFQIQGRPIIVASFSEGRLLLVDYSAGAIAGDLRLPRNCRDVFDVSPQTHLAVTGYNYEDCAQVDVWSLADSRKVDTLLGRGAIDLVLFGRGDVVLIADETGTSLWERRSGLVRPLRGALPPSTGCAIENGRSYLIGHRVGPRVFRIDEPQQTIQTVPLPVRKGVWAIRASPRGDCLAVLDATGRISLLDASDLTNRWVRRFEDASWVCFSGDGTLIGVQLQVRPPRTVVLDADSGDRVATYDDTMCGCYPLIGNLCLRLDGAVLDLRNGTVSEGVSRSSWWRARGL